VTTGLNSVHFQRLCSCYGSQQLVSKMQLTCKQKIKMCRGPFSWKIDYGSIRLLLDTTEIKDSEADLRDSSVNVSGH
jgi:hypothetical protein